MKIASLFLILLYWFGKLALTIIFMLWDILVFITDILDSDNENDTSADTEPYYNYHTGEMDAVKHWNGLYDEEH